MQTSGLFTCPPENFVVNVALGQPLYFVPFGDVHADSALHTEDLFNEFLAWVKDTPNVVLLGMGDYLDFLSARGRVALARMKVAAQTEMHDENADRTIEAIEKDANGEVSKFAEKLKSAGMEGRLMGMLDGNHDFVFKNGENVTMRLCRYLDCRYLGVASYLGLTLEACGVRRTVEIWAHHGKGAARLPGGSINRVAQMAEQAEADIFCMGHDHKRSATPGVRLRRIHTRMGAQVSHREMYYLRTGSFTKAYEDGVRSYSIDGNMNPNPLGVVKVILTMRRPSLPGESHKPGPVEVTMQTEGPTDDDVTLNMEALS